MFNSLLWLEKSTFVELNPKVIEDLGMNRFYEAVIGEDESYEMIIGRLCTDMETIRYRQDIVRDLMEQPKLSDYLAENLSAFSGLVFQFTKAKYDAMNFYFLVELVTVVEQSIDCLESLFATLRGYDFRSEGLNQLRRVVEKQVESDAFKEMKKDLAEIRHAFSQVKSAEISINMNLGMRPVEAQVTKLLDHKVMYPNAFRKVALVMDEKGTFLNHFLSQYVPVYSIPKIDLDLKDELEYGLRDYDKILRHFLQKYNKIDPMPFVSLHQEIVFYQTGVHLLRDMSKSHLPMCIPELSESYVRTMYVKDGYNVNLSGKMNVADIVLNDFTLDDRGRIVVLTGANSGGKTTFTQAVGQIQLLAQLGFLVPAKKAQISLVSGIFTHFPALENETVTLGRLGKECQDFAKIYHDAINTGLILLNESFSSTSHLESLTIASEVIKACKKKQVRLIYNTHLHELYDYVFHLNETMDNNTKIISMVSGSEVDIQSFHICKAPPLGKSYAKRIAESYGVTYEQLMARVEASDD